MYYVICLSCGMNVEIPPDAVGEDRTDPWNVTQCLECQAGFDYDDEEVHHDVTPSQFI